MNTSLQVWRTESSPLKQRLATGFAMGAGLVFCAFSFRDLPAHWPPFAFGLLLLAIGLGSALFAGREAITVDPRARHIVIQKTSRWRQHDEVIRFDDIAEVSLDTMGDDEGGTPSHHVVARLRNGKKVVLFFGFYDGAHDKAAMQARAERLQGYLANPR